MTVEIKAFRSQKYGDLYRLRFEQDQSSSWAVFVESHPDNPRGGSNHDTHILSGNRLCLAEAPATKERAIALALTWIHYFSNYIRTGETRQPSVRAHVNED